MLAARESGANATTQGVSAVLPLSGHPGSVAAGAEALWIPYSDTHIPVRDLPLLHLDLASDNTVGLPIYEGGEIRYLTHVGAELIGTVELAGGRGSGPSAVVALDWRKGQQLGRRQFDGLLGPLVRTGNDLWVLRLRPAALLRLDARTLAPTALPLSLAGGRAGGLAAGDGRVWVTLPDAGEVARIDTSTRSITRAQVGGAPAAVAVAAGIVWVVDPGRGELLRLRPDTLDPIGEPLHLGGRPSSVAATRLTLFVGDAARGTVRRIDLRTGSPIGSPVRVASPSGAEPPLALTPAGNSVWASSFAATKLTRVSERLTTPLRAVPVSEAVRKPAANVLPIPAAGTVVAKLKVPPQGGPVAVGEGAVWALSNVASTLLRIDPTRNTIVAKIPMPPGEDAAAGDGAVWITHPDEHAVSRIDPETNAVSATIPVRGRPAGIALSPGAVWVANPDGPSVDRIDPATNRVVATIPVGRDKLYADHMSLTVRGDAVWVASPTGKRLMRVDRRTNTVTKVATLDFFPCGQLVVAAGSVWSAGADCTDVVERVDSRSGRRMAELWEPHAVGVARGFGSIWVAAADTQNVERIEPRTARVFARVHVGGFPIRLGVGFGSIWVNDDRGRILRIEPTS